MKGSPQPHSIEAEVSLLAALLGNEEIIPLVRDIVNPPDFYRENHIYISRAIYTVGNDLVVIQEWLKKHGLWEKAGGIEYLGTLVEAASTSASWEYHAKVVKQYAHKRMLIGIAAGAQEMAAADHYDLEATLSLLIDGIRQIQGSQNGRGDTEEMAAVVKDVYRDIERKAESGNHYIGVKCGFDNIDEQLRGFERKSIIYPIGRPGMGKTAVIAKMARYMGSTYKAWTLFFSLEMAKSQIVRRALADESNIDLTRIRTGNIAEGQWEKLAEAAKALSGSRVTLLDESKYKWLDKLTAKAAALANQYPLTAIFIDHIQLIRARGKFNTRHQEISHISNELKAMAKDLDVPVFVACQLSRKVEDRPDKRPRLSDMKESGDLEQDADLVISLFRDPKDEKILALEVLKGRDVGTFTTALEFNRHTQTLRDKAELRYYEPPEQTRSGKSF